MSDPVPAPAIPDAPSDTTPPKKKPKLLRLGWKSLIFLLIVVIVVAVVTPIWANAEVKAVLLDQLLARGLVPDDPNKIKISVLGGSIHADDLHLLDASDKSEAAHATTINVQIAVMDSLKAWDAIIQDITIEGMSGTLRRRPDGRPPVITPPTTTATGAAPMDWSKVDWQGYYQYTMQKAKDEYDASATAAKTASATAPAPAKPVPPAPVIDPDWPGAVTYQPTPSADRHTPRVVIRTLSISGGKLDLPDASPLDIETFSVKGTNIADRQDAGEVMTMTVNLTTAGAGPITLDLKRQSDGDGSGTLNVAAPQLPLTLLNDPQIAGADLPKWGSSGTAALTAVNSWTGWNLTGTVTSVLTGLALDPQPGAPSDAPKIAQAVNAMKGKPITWPVKLGGTLYAPVVTDSGYQQAVMGNALGIAEGIIGDKASAAAAAQIQKQLGNNPAAANAVNGLGNSLGLNLGGGTATGPATTGSATTAAPASAAGQAAGALKNLFGH